MNDWLSEDEEGGWGVKMSFFNPEVSFGRLLEALCPGWGVTSWVRVWLGHEGVTPILPGVSMSLVDSPGLWACDIWSRKALPMAGKAGTDDCSFPKDLPLPIIGTSVRPLPTLRDRGPFTGISFLRSGVSHGTGAWAAGSGEARTSTDETLAALRGPLGELWGSACVEEGDAAGSQDSFARVWCRSCSAGEVSGGVRGLNLASRPCSVTG